MAKRKEPQDLDQELRQLLKEQEEKYVYLRFPDGSLMRIPKTDQLAQGWKQK